MRLRSGLLATLQEFHPLRASVSDCLRAKSIWDPAPDKSRIPSIMRRRAACRLCALCRYPPKAQLVVRTNLTYRAVAVAKRPDSL